MNLLLVCYFLCGICFALATHSHKHLFSEGHERRPDRSRPGPMDGLLAWALLCACLWPLMAITGIYSFWRLRRRRIPAARDHRR